MKEKYIEKNAFFALLQNTYGECFVLNAFRRFINEIDTFDF